MISRSEFDHGVDLIANTFNRRVQADARETWFRLLGPEFTRDEWVRACTATIREDESFPSNFVRVLISRRPRRTSMQPIEIDPDTGEPFTPEEAHMNRARLSTLLQIIGDKVHPMRAKILTCAEASLREDDGVEARSKWGGYIEEMLDSVLERNGSMGEEAKP